LKGIGFDTLGVDWLTNSTALDALAHCCGFVTVTGLILGIEGGRNKVNFIASAAADSPGDRFSRPLDSQAHKRTFPAVAFLFFIVAGVLARAQTPEFLPEIDAYLKVNPVVRVYFQAKGDRDEGVPVQATLGPSLQVYFKPLVKLKKVTAFDLDDAKQRPLVVEAGYRYITAPNEPVDNRFMPVATFRLPTKGSLLITDRNRADLDWKGGTFKWRYRNKLTLERAFSIRSYHLTPNLSAEPYYTSQYAKWSTTDLYAGCLLPVGKHVQFDPYFEHENNTGKSPNQQVNDLGLAAHIFFSMPK
jgi:hypothetical protein